MSFFYPIGELFQVENVRAVFLVEDESLLLPELEYLKLKTGQDTDTFESETDLSKKETGDSSQNLPAVSGIDAEEYLASLYSKSGEPETRFDPEILSRFSLVKSNKEEFSLVYDPEFFKNLWKYPEQEVQSKKLVGLLYPYGIASNQKISGQFGSSSPSGASPQPLGQTSAQLQIKDLAPWADKVLEKIEKNWIIDPARPQGKKGTIGVSVTITKSGDISSVKVIKSSGEKELDFSAVNAVKRSVPLPGLPILYPAKSIVFIVEFEYDG